MKTLLVISLFLSQFSFAKSRGFHIDRPTHQVRRYLRIQKQFSKKFCSAGQDHKYEELLRSYRGAGYFVPVLDEVKLDREAIKSLMGEFDLKGQWISEQLDFLSKRNKLPKTDQLTFFLEKSISELLIIREYYDRENNSALKSEYKERSKRVMKRLKHEFERVLLKVPFMKSYRFPIDFFELRNKYDLVKDIKDEESQKQKNQTYLYRKIVEDGTFNNQRRRGDKYFRALVNTLYLRLSENNSILKDYIRYDLDDFISQLKRYLSEGIDSYRSRFANWQSDVFQAKNFYEGLIREPANALEAESSRKRVFKLLKKKSDTRFNLKEYTLKQQSKVYDFWRAQPKLMRALYVLETILFNEVGSIDGRDALERRDVAQVVLNRFRDPEYNQLDDEDSLVEHLSLALDQTKKYKWLNVLFKEGEFSFTYYFISSSVKVFCPDMSLRGRFLRRSNLLLSLSVLSNPNWDFKAVRYFSRASMLGRIDMGKLWDEFRPIPQRPGRHAKHRRFLRKQLKDGMYRYLYSFHDPEGEKYRVLEIRGETYVYGIGRKRFFKFRNPHYFVYFEPQALQYD